MKYIRDRLTAMLLVGVLATGNAAYASAEETAADEVSGAVETENISVTENDQWYQEAIGFLEYLGIFTGDETGDMKPEEAVTRAEIAAIILREMNITTMSEYNNTFNDVDSSHWAADIIQTAYDNGIINGYDDGSFGPDEDVTYEQAVKMVICAVNYENYALRFGSYPDGYLKIANDEDITDHVSGTVGEPITRRNIAKLVYNSLTIPYPVTSSITQGIIEYTTNDNITILSEKRDIYYAEGTVTATPNMSVDQSVNVNDGQIFFEGQTMKSELSDPEKYVAEYVRLFYFDPDGSGSDKTALHAVPLANKTESVTINADDINYIRTAYTEGSTSQISYYEDNGSSRTKTVRFVEYPIIVYNDQPFTQANFSSLDAQDADGSKESFDEFITPSEGSVRAVDFGKDGDYDIMFIESYETSVVKTATPIRLQLEYPISCGDMIELDEAEDESLNVTVIKNDETVGVSDLTEGDVVSFRMSANFADPTYTGNKYITIEASNEYIEGTVNSVRDDDTGYYAYIDNKEYKIIRNEDIYRKVRSMLNTNGKFYYNKMGTIAETDGEVVGGLSSGEKYGWLINVYTENGPDDVVAKLYSQDGSIQVLPLEGSVDYWAPDATESKKTTATEIDELINNTEEGNAYFLNCKAIDVNERVSIRLCKYKTNSSGNITRLYLAVDESTVSEDSSAVRVSTTDFKDSNTSFGLFAGEYLIDSEIPQLTVPISFRDMGDEENYSYRIASHEDFTTALGDTTLGYNCFFADVSNYSPGITIRMTKSTSEAQSIDEYNTADDNPVIVVSAINEAVDDEGDPIYVIKGYRDGQEVEYTTARNVLVAQVNPAVRLDKETYDTTTIWTGDSDVSLKEVLHPGDICGMDGSASNVGIILRMVDTTGLAEYLINGGAPGSVQSGQFKYDEQFSASRDRVIFGYVTQVGTTPIVRYNIAVDGSTSADEDGDITEDGSTLVTVGVPDLSQAVHIINISDSGNIRVEREVSDAYEIESGDYVFMRRFKNDASRELYVIRYGG